MHVALIVLWTALLVGGVVLIVVGVRVRRTDQVRSGAPGNSVVLIGVVLVVGAGTALRQEASR